MERLPMRPGMPGAVPMPLDEVLHIAGEFERGGRLDEAARLLDHILAAQPDHGDTMHLAGVVAFRRGDEIRALELMERSLHHGNNIPLYLRNICELYRVLGRMDDALDAASRATALAPADPLCLMNQAIIHYHRLELDAALDSGTRALRFNPSLAGAHFVRAESLLLRGDWPEGWAEYEWRFRIDGAAPPMPRSETPHWDGGALGGGTLLLVADQGFGDVIQFSRYIPWARERCAGIAIACDSEMAPLLRQIVPAATLFTRWQDCPAHAAFCTLSGLPRLARTVVETVPAPIPYLRADPDRVSRWAARLDGLVPKGLRRIGVIWAGRPTHKNDRNRSAALADLAPLGEVSGIALLALQKGPGTGQAGGWYGRAPLVNLGAEIRDYDDTMAILANIECLVTVDTSVAHLAGAMGRTVWVMLPFVPDWRWLLSRDDTPWYPTMRLFRQSSARRWSDVLEAVALALIPDRAAAQPFA
jgi:tetratricopeptide (TPR) repeat protein